MKHYFIEILTFSCKNKAHEALQRHVIQYDHKLMNENNLEETISSIKIMKDAINQAYPRCAKIKIDEYSCTFLDTMTVGVDSNFRILARPVKGFMIDEPILI